MPTQSREEFDDERLIDDEIEATGSVPVTQRYRALDSHVRAGKLPAEELR